MPTRIYVFIFIAHAAFLRLQGKKEGESIPYETNSPLNFLCYGKNNIGSVGVPFTRTS